MGTLFATIAVELSLHSMKPHIYVSIPPFPIFFSLFYTLFLESSQVYSDFLVYFCCFFNILNNVWLLSLKQFLLLQESTAAFLIPLNSSGNFLWSYSRKAVQNYYDQLLHQAIEFSVQYGCGPPCLLLCFFSLVDISISVIITIIIASIKYFM